MNEKELEQLSEEQQNKLPAHLRMRLGYLKLQKEKLEQQQDDNKEQQQDNEEQQDEKKAPEVTPRELFSTGYDTKLKQEEKDGLSD
ncbi:hypothetical protein [Bacillus paralicheniformis]|uniref:hypothetical protein n=1 Tax=Bacillus paralicheniformis TaxID=1648923 RepID=UPI00189F563A|nr:hypothetical protein [Bacillus paralicheniformis]